MTRRREIRTYDYVNQPYEAVRLSLQTDAATIFRQATSRGAVTAADAELRVHLGALEVATQIEINVAAMQPARSPIGKPGYSISFTWASPRHRDWFPTMNATLTIYPLTSTETQLDFDGFYEPPLGALGAAVDAIALHRFAEASVVEFLREVAAYLRTEIGEPARSGSSASATSASSQR